ncbi:hypothetical protein [Aequorivita sp. KMM 9714]|uniref:hypothetical protein n=1 Tax=Aequorivita sp. KMM 9714 TaxID=2707173 RepID=UPI0013EC996F|nr:hypothetical protein [Aequorivita sp. KMM 9714]NGX84154.1 hypothetical protein [Aequorivita sp. KMM 9714]
MRKFNVQTLISFAFIYSTLSFTFMGYSQVGINTASPTTTLDVNGGISLRESPVPLVVSGVNNNIDLSTAPYSVYRIVTNSQIPISIGSITPVPGADGQVVRLINTTNQDITIKHNYILGSSKILCPSETDLKLVGENSSVTLQFSKTLSKWTVLSYSKSTKKNHTIFGTENITFHNPQWSDIPGLEIKIRPLTSKVYVTYNLFGELSPNNQQAFGQIRLTVNGGPIANSEMKLNDSGYYQIALPMFPLDKKVDINGLMTIKVQWRFHGGGNIVNNPGNGYHHRYLSIYTDDVLIVN